MARGSGDPRKRGRPGVSANEKRAERRARRSARRRKRVVDWTRRIRPVDVAVFALTMAVSVWAWGSFAIGENQDLAAASAIITLASLAASFVLIVNLQVRIRFRRPGFESADVPLILLPVIAVPVVALVITPPSTPAPGYLDWVTIYGVILLTGLLSLLGALTAVLLYLLVVWPILLLIDAIRPSRETDGEPLAPDGLSGMTAEYSRGQLVVVAVILLASVAFALAMVNVYPDATGGTRQQRFETFLRWMTFRGEPLPSLLALGFALVAAAATWASYRVRQGVDGSRAKTETHSVT